MESLNPELALYGSKNECARTNIVLLPISEVSTGAVSLRAVYTVHSWVQCTVSDVQCTINIPPLTINKITYMQRQSHF